MERKKSFEFKGIKYTIEFPTVGEYIKIETEKLDVSLGKFGNLISSGTVSSYRAIQMIQSISLLTVLCPDLVKNLNVDSFSEIDAKDFIDLIKIYQKEIAPWYNDWFKEFNELLNDVDESIKDIGNIE